MSDQMRFILHSNIFINVKNTRNEQANNKQSKRSGRLGRIEINRTGCFGGQDKQQR